MSLELRGAIELVEDDHRARLFIVAVSQTPDNGNTDRKGPSQLALA
ncbi:MAG: hypothetical protein MI757_00350 [Pirellulales bacterium]|nr:hypothetical protein [Pirellulales bacterium]